MIGELPSLGLSSICNVLAAIKTAKHFGLGPDDVVVTVATDGAAMYDSERELAVARYFPDGFDEVAAAEVLRRASARRGHRQPPRAHARGARADLQPRLLHLGRAAGRLDRGLPGPPGARRSGGEQQALAAGWDELIDEFNARTGVLDER